MTMASGETSPRKVTRKGKWSAEEEDFTTRIIECFNNGLLSLPEGTTLRSYLADKLNCDPMRITKKFSGSSCLGKRVFHSSLGGGKLRTEPAPAAEVERAHRELHVLEHRFVDACLRSTESKDTRMIDLEARFLHSSNVVSTPAIDAFIMQSCQPLWDPDGIRDRQAAAAAGAGNLQRTTAAKAPGNFGGPDAGPQSPPEGMRALDAPFQGAPFPGNAQRGPEAYGAAGQAFHAACHAAAQRAARQRGGAPPGAAAGYDEAYAHAEHRGHDPRQFAAMQAQQRAAAQYHRHYASPYAPPPRHLGRDGAGGAFVPPPYRRHAPPPAQRPPGPRAYAPPPGPLRPAPGDEDYGNHVDAVDCADGAEEESRAPAPRNEAPGAGARRARDTQDASLAADLFHGFVKSLHREDSHNDLVDFVEDVNDMQEMQSLAHQALPHRQQRGPGAGAPHDAEAGDAASRKRSSSSGSLDARAVAARRR